MGRFQCSMLDCIKDTMTAMDNIVNHRKENTQKLRDAFDQKKDIINEIVFVGSGTSSTSALTARIFAEKTSGLKSTVVFPNDFLFNTSVYNPNALYLFTSQTGTSIVARQALNFVKEKGWLHAAISESADTPMAKEADLFVTMDCGIEEYPMRTTGYCASVLTHMMIALEIGLMKGVLSQNEYDEYIEEAKRLSQSQKTIIDQALQWMDVAKRKMLRSDLIVFTGGDALYGVSLEGAMKVWETPQIASVGYEIEEGIHGPNYGYNSRHCVIVLNDGKREDRKCLALARYMKEVHNNGFVIGNSVVDEEDLKVELLTENFTCLELIVAVQVLSYRLALDQGRDLFAHHDNSRMNSYFKTHA